MGAVPLPPLPRYQGTDPMMQLWSQQMIYTLETWARSLRAPVGESWTVNGTTTARDVDPAVITTVAGVVNALGTLVQDLALGAPVKVT
ncbi:MAG TPA: hypothetical protein VH024_17520 [Candidatus Angelobacter sp.]|jgi:hypothetical protein|nr:hypothetical protein [Candidatus Angelobacter sp.]